MSSRPASISSRKFTDGFRRWWQGGTEDGPANDPPARVYESGEREWRTAGNQMHRIGRPAYEGLAGYREWWVNGKLHRTDGPAVEYVDGDREWYIQGANITPRVHGYVECGMSEADALSAVLIELEQEDAVTHG